MSLGLEAAVEAARSGEISDEELVTVFGDASVIYIGRLEDDDPTSFQPLVLSPPVAEGGEVQQMVVVFSDASRIPPEAPTQATMMLQVSGRQVIETLPEGLGVALNPGSEVSMELPPAAIPAVRGVLGSDTPSP
ncbi:SseB family protein [Falsarthrobacter nasiphocae]|uniref:SseB protein N-terminal domain-containing protein n=1 Tax=Falsarthrobacter nasiphocae TaxID=189863 RepID=A0AAE4C5F2_9MICC|nr:SseB family protein [Falsarthrobacter nasiphocae]MDR6892281.1 hypothetical protein [Falsarthrobacter nasiphocae]